MSKKVLFLLGSADISGGTYVIFQHASHLQKMGYEVTIALVFMQLSALENLKNNMPWHPAIGELSFIHINDAFRNEYDVAIFTWWATVFSFEKIKAKSFVYFVQSIESRFYRKDQTFIRDLVKRTYKLKLPVITEAVWIKKYLEENYACPTELVRNGIRKELYTANGSAFADKSPQKLRILVEGPIESDFKNVKKTIALCLEANVGEVWLLTSSVINHYPGVTRVFSKVAIDQVPQIYRSCDVLVKLSYVEGMFGPPLEIFHCGGTAIVYEVTGHDEYIKHEENALVAKKDDEKAVIQYLRKLNQDRSYLAKLIQGAKETAAKWIDWDVSSNAFAKSLEQSMSYPYDSNAILSKIKKSFREKIDITQIVNSKSQITTVEALPLYDTGQYSLTIIIPFGKTQFGIVFGKLYQRFYVMALNVETNDGSKVNGAINFTLNNIKQLPDQSFEALSESGMFVINANTESTSRSSDTKLCFVIKFAPLMIREKLERKTTKKVPG